jgi:hypothetical protein
MVFNATFSNVSVSSWQSVLLVDHKLISEMLDKMFVLYLGLGLGLKDMELMYMKEHQTHNVSVDRH